MIVFHYSGQSPQKGSQMTTKVIVGQRSSFDSIPVFRGTTGQGRAPGPVLSAVRSLNHGECVPIGMDPSDDFDKFKARVNQNLRRKGAVAFPIQIVGDRVKGMVTVYRTDSAEAE